MMGRWVNRAVILDTQVGRCHVAGRAPGPRWKKLSVRDAVQLNTSGWRHILDTTGNPETVFPMRQAPVLQIRESANRTMCCNNLKQIGLAVHHCQKTYNKLPPAIGAFPNPSGNAYGSIQFICCPFWSRITSTSKRLPQATATTRRTTIGTLTARPMSAGER